MPGPIIGCISPDKPNGRTFKCEECKVAENPEECANWCKIFQSIQITMDDYQNILRDGYRAWLNGPLVPRRPKPDGPSKPLEHFITGTYRDNDDGGGEGVLRGGILGQGEQPETGFGMETAFEAEGAEA